MVGTWRCDGAYSEEAWLKLLKKYLSLKDGEMKAGEQQQKLKQEWEQMIALLLRRKDESKATDGGEGKKTEE